MAAWLIAAIERLPRRARRVVVAAAAMLLLAAAITALTLPAGPDGGARTPTPTAPTGSHQSSEGPAPPSVRSPDSASELQRADLAAGRFLVTYLQLAYGRAGARAVTATTPGLRRQLIRERAQVTPAERRLHPRVASLRLVGTTPGFVVATAIVEDGGIAAYGLRFTLQVRAGRWLVSSVQEG